MIDERSALADEAMAQIEALASYQRRAFCNHHAIHREVSMPQLYLLINLQEHGSLTVSEMADVLGVSAPSTSAIIDRMEERELVTRVRDEVDRRVVHVAISERGRKMVDELAGLKRDKVQQLLTGMDDEELGHVIHAIQALRRALDRLHLPGDTEPVTSPL